MNHLFKLATTISFRPFLARLGGCKVCSQVHSSNPFPCIVKDEPRLGVQSLDCSEKECTIGCDRMPSLGGVYYGDIKLVRVYQPFPFPLSFHILSPSSLSSSLHNSLSLHHHPTHPPSTCRCCLPDALQFFTRPFPPSPSPSLILSSTLDPSHSHMYPPP